MINNENIFSLENSSQPHNFYVYVRLYRSVYKSAFNPANIIDKGLQIIDQKARVSNGNQVEFFNHSAINVNLKDNFLGLTIAPGDKPDLRPETIDKKKTNNNYINSCDHDKSQYSVYTMECSSEDYSNICNLLKMQTKFDLTEYSTVQNAIIALSKISYNIINLFKHKRSTSREDFNDVDKHTGQVCSTFIMNVLYNCVKKVRKYIDRKHLSVDLFTPNDIVNKIPDMKFCFGGTFNTYITDCNNFIKTHPEHGALL